MLFVRLCLLVFFLSSCAYATLGDRKVSVTGDQIAQKLNEKLSVPFALLKIFNVSLSNSVVTFDQTTGRMMTSMDTALSSQLFKQTLAGKLGISGKLRFDAATSSVMLEDPKVESLQLNGAEGKINDLLSGLAKTVGGQMLNGLTLYKVKPEDLRFAGTQYAPKNMQVTAQGLQITLSPQK